MTPVTLKQAYESGRRFGKEPGKYDRISAGSEFLIITDLTNGRRYESNWYSVKELWEPVWYVEPEPKKPHIHCFCQGLTVATCCSCGFRLPDLPEPRKLPEPRYAVVRNKTGEIYTVRDTLNDADKYMKDGCMTSATFRVVLATFSELPGKL